MYAGRIEDGLPVLDVRAYAWLPGPDLPSIIYTHQLTVTLLEDDGALADADAVLTRARQLGWVETWDYAGWAAPCSGWEAHLAGEDLLVRQPDGAAWYDGTLPATDAWRAAARRAGQLYHFTAATGDVNSIGRQIVSGRALAVVSTLD
ncbi:hypothetical protein K388_07180 [Streptomyces sp. KhCrAH-43]|uniref:hypothetical protein n=1 Tax=unclassified Streptomyces TaxID=2593676 RepID=UPI000DB9ACA7|nr:MULTISPECIES: hypothetical protein [unclassified Streptomyces]MYS39112.1 hypothetical protein [Streptomyces sp. SID4920]MYX63945.1 hypothetical protein [Streptomyces sp. SID8373]RAJ47799.1 hypothetical protein K388_07180 [Streptomyces sp. KhCrAH-43]